MADRKGRIAQLVHKDVSDIVLDGELKSDLTSLASVNEVRMNPDNTVATVYVTHLDANKADELLAFLSANKGRIRSALAKRLDVYKVPQLVFKKDDLYERGRRIDEILEEAQKPEKTLSTLSGKPEEGERKSKKVRSKGSKR